MPSTDGRLKGKVAMISGASRGIGRAIALCFAREGAFLSLSARNEAALAELSAEIRTLTGREPLTVPVDVKDASKVEVWTDKTLDKYERIDILVNNAGVTRDGLFVRMDEADWDEVLDTNLKGAFLCCRAVAKTMMRQRSGKIINMASVIGLIGNAGQANYAASKAGIIALSKSVAKELGSRNVQVNAIAPGFIETEMTGALSDQVKEGVLKNIPAGRFGTPEDIARTALYLASGESDFITGQVITVDGGMVM